MVSRLIQFLVFFVTGQVATFRQRGALNVRQLGFQETDIVDMAKPITKLAIQIKSPADVENALHEGFFEANRGRPGPIIIDIPDDIQWTSYYFERRMPYETRTLLSVNYIKHYARNIATPSPPSF